MDQFSASVQELYYDFLDSDLVAAVVDFGTKLINVLDNIIEAFGSVTTSIAGIGLVTLLKDITQMFTGKGSGGIVKVFTQGMTEAISSVTVGAASASSALAGVGSKVAGAFTSSIGPILAVVAAISTAVVLFNKLYKSAQDIIDEGEDAQTSINSAYSNYSSRAQTVTTSGQRYTELAPGVNTETNQNISLTNDEYEEYLALCNDIAEIYPELVTSYDEQGNAILNLGDNAESTTEQLEALLEADKALANSELAGQIEKVFNGAVTQIQQYQDEISALENGEEYASNLSEGLSQAQKDLREALEQSLGGETSEEISFVMDYEAFDASIGALQEALREFKIDIHGERGITSEETGLIDTEEVVITPMVELDEDEANAAIAAALDAMGGTTYEIQSELREEMYSNPMEERTIQKEIDDVWNNAMESYVYNFQMSSLFDALSEEVQDGLIDALSNIDYSQVEGMSSDEITEFLRKNYIVPVTDAFINEDASQEVQDAFTSLFSIDTSKLNTSEYSSEISDALDIVRDYFDEVYPTGGEEYFRDFVLNFGFEVELDNGKLALSSTVLRGTLQDFFAETEEDVDEYTRALSNMTVDQLQEMYDYVMDSAFARGEMTFSDVYDELFSEVEEAAKNPISLSDLFITDDGEASDFSEELDTFQSDIDDIQSTLDSIRNGEEINFMDTIQDFEGLSKYVGDLSEGTEDLSAALESLQWDKLENFSKSWESATEGLEGTDLDAMNKLFIETLSQVDFSPYVENFRQTYEEYKQIVEDMNNLSISAEEPTEYGNVDLVNREIIDWTEENLEANKDSLASWSEGVTDAMGDALDDAEDYINDFTALLGSFDTFGEAEIPIAFTPIMQTDEGGAELLDKDTIYKYIDLLLEEVEKEFGEGWTFEDLLTIDAKGITVDGKKIKNVIADIGDTAEQTAQAMQYIGEGGTLTTVLRRMGISGDVADQLMAEYGENELAMEAIVMLSLNSEAAEWDFEQFCDQIEDAEIYIQLQANVDELEDLQKEMEKLEDEQSLLESSQSLSEAMGIKKTTRDYKDLINNSKKQTKNIQEQNKNLEAQRDLYSALGRDTSELDSQIVSNTNSLRGALEQQIEWNNAALALTYNQALEGIDTLRSAMSEAVSDTRLSGDTIKSIMDTFSGVEGYNAQELFVQTSSGVELNVESLKNLEDEYVKLEKSNYASQLADLGKQYQDSQDYIDSLGDAVKNLTQEEKDMILEAAGYRGITGLENDITYLDLLMTSLDGATSKYQTWVNATSATNPSAAFESMGDYYETAGDLIERGWYDNEGLNAYLDLMLSADRRTGDVVEDYKKLSEVIEGTEHSLKDYWTTDESGNLTSLGAYQFADDLIAIMGEEYGTWSEENGYQFTLWGDEQIQAIADTFGTSTDYIRAMIDAMDEAGFTVKTYEDYVNDALVALEEFNEENQEISLSTDFDFEISEMSLDEINDTIESLESDRVVIEAKIEDETDDDVIAGLQEQLDNLDLSIEALNQQRIELNIQSEIDEGNLQELDRLIEAGEHEEVAMRLGIEYDVDNEEAMAQLDAYELYLQSIAQQDRVETAIEVALEGEETVDSLLEAYDNEELDVVLGIEGEEEIDAAYQKLQQMQEESATYDVTVRIDEEQFEQLTTPDVDVDANTKPAQTAVDELITEINEMEATITVNTQTAGSEESTTTTQYDASETITTSGVVEFSADYKEVEDSEAPSKDGIVGYSVEDDDVQGYAAPEKTGIASYIVDSSRIDSWRAPSKVGIVIYTADTHLLPTTFSDLHRKVIYEAEGDTNGSLATGTATSVPSIPHVHAAGTAYSSWTNYQHSIGAYAGGTWQDWSIPHDETALTNEVGQESIVRSGKWMLIPGGAHFEDLKRGDIVNKTRIYLVTGI